MKNSAMKLFFNFTGSVFLLLGIAGVILPLVPATPFLLLAGFFFSRGSPRFHRWIIHHKYFGPPIKDWETRGVISRNNKIIATLMLGISALLLLLKSDIVLFGKVGFSLFATVILIFVWSRPNQ